MAKKYIFIGADRMINAGEADYSKAFALFINENNIAVDDVFFCRIQKQYSSVSETFSSLCTIDAPVHQLPIDNDIYDRSPYLSQRYLHKLKLSPDDDVEIIGAGHSTLAALSHCKDTLAARGIHARANYISHIVDETASKSLQEMNARIFAPPTDMPAALLSSYMVLTAVPHSYTVHSCVDEYKKMMNGTHQAFYKNLIADQTPFTIAIINGGFDTVDGWAPYTEAESYIHGYALGLSMPPGTALIAAHGGPRNLQDEQRGHRTIEKFTEAYLQAQKENGADPAIHQECFSKVQEYNFIKASFALARLGNCRRYVSNAEGYGTMAGILTHLPRSIDLGSFQYSAVTTYRKNENDLYHRMGIRHFVPDKKGITVNIHPLEIQTGLSDPTAQVFKSIGLIASAPDALCLKTTAQSLAHHHA